MPRQVQSVHETVVGEQAERTTNRGVGRKKGSMGGNMSHQQRGARLFELQSGKNNQCETIKKNIDDYEEKNCDDDGCKVDEEKIQKVRNSVNARGGMPKKCKKRINTKLDDIEKRKKNIQSDIKF